MADKTTIDAELRGSLEAARGMKEREFYQGTKKNIEYGGNHILQITKYLNKRDRILELGAGTGWASSILYGKGFNNLVVSDICPYDLVGLKAVRRLIPGKVETKIMDFENIKFQEKSMDAIFMVAALHHSSDIHRVAMEVHRVLKDGKKWFICGEPVRGWLDGENREMSRSRADGFNDNFYYWHYYRKEIGRAGFVVRALFPLELHKFLIGEIKDNCKTRYKKWLLTLAKEVYRNELGRRFIWWIYPKSLYFVGSHAVIVCTKDSK